VNRDLSSVTAGVGSFGRARWFAVVFVFACLAYVPTASAAGCSNEAFRTGPSAFLSDCRAYELVTPPEGTAPFFKDAGELAFGTPTATADGESVLFSVKGGALPGTEATGTTDRYRAVRTSDGWVTSLAGPTARQAAVDSPGGASFDHLYSFWQINNNAGAVSAGRYLHEPDGTLRLLGEGSVTDDQFAIGRYISPNGEHVILTSYSQLQPNAPEAPGCCFFFVFFIAGNEPVDAVYELGPSGAEVISLFPNGDTPTWEQATYYWGTSENGESVVFSINERFNEETTLYVRNGGVVRPIVTRPIPGETIFEGASSDGKKIFYLVGPSEQQGETGGELFVYDVQTEESTPVAPTATDMKVVNISKDGSHVYFLSGQQLDGANGTPGGPNLYVWDGTTVKFIAELAEEDITREDRKLIYWPLVVGMAQQTTAIGPGEDPSRTTPDGSVFVFESYGQLTDYDNEGRLEVYRYSAADGGLTCVSCDQQGDAPTGNALLQGTSPPTEPGTPTTGPAIIPNVTDDGSRVYFMSSDPLVPGDIDGQQDVYEWHDGNLSLISYGRSPGTKDWLYGMSTDGRDVFFTSSDLLVPQKEGATTALYDARIGGGFPSDPFSAPCTGESCHGEPTPPPNQPAVGTATFVGPGNPPNRRRAKKRPCRHKHGKAKKRCLQKHRKHRASANSNGRVG
jgi:hypothetical protein